MPNSLRIPYEVSPVPSGPGHLELHDSHGIAVATVSSIRSSDAVTLRLNIGARIVATGPLLDPRWRAQVATDTRLCFSPRRDDRTALLRLLSNAAVCWDDYQNSLLSRT